jgi:hypothetical protein
MGEGIPVSWLLIEPGWTALAEDGEPIGTIATVVGDSDKDIFDGLAVDVRGANGTRYVAAEVVSVITEGAVRLALPPETAAALPPHEPSVGLRILPDSGPRVDDDAPRR